MSSTFWWRWRYMEMIWTWWPKMCLKIVMNHQVHIFLDNPTCWFEFNCKSFARVGGRLSCNMWVSLSGTVSSFLWVEKPRQWGHSATFYTPNVWCLIKYLLTPFVCDWSKSMIKFQLGWLPSGKLNIAMENHHFSWESSLQMVIFSSYFDITRGYS